MIGDQRPFAHEAAAGNQSSGSAVRKTPAKVPAARDATRIPTVARSGTRYYHRPSESGAQNRIDAMGTASSTLDCRR